MPRAPMTQPVPPKKTEAMFEKPIKRIAVYGRHSTAMQTSTSSSDQAASFLKLVDYLGGSVVDTYLDPEKSGYSRNRQGLRDLLAAVEVGRIDVVVCESLDRLARDAEDVAWVGKKLAYHRVALHTVSEGHVDEIKFAVAGLLGAIFIKHLVDKTLRGMAAARRGRSLRRRARLWLQACRQVRRQGRAGARSPRNRRG